MKIFDRYIIASFLRNYVLSFVVLVGLYIALDMVFHFDELTRGPSMQGNTSEGASVMAILTLIVNIGEFYFYQMFAFFVQLSGVIPVVAAGFTLVRMMRFNELTAMLAAGVPMVRIAIPVILAGMVMSVLVVVDQEVIIPNITDKLVRDHDEVGMSRASSFRITALEDAAGSLLMAARYDPPGLDNEGHRVLATMDEMDVIVFNKEREPIAHIQADQAIYKDGVWTLTNGWRQTGLRPGDTISTTPVPEWKSDLGPNEIALYRRSRFVEVLSTPQINNLLEHPRNYGTVPLLRVKHARIVQPLTNVLLLLLAIPCILTREPNALKATATRTVLITGACMAVVFISYQLAGRPPTPESTWFWPALMLWTPIFIFGPIAVWMMDRLKT